MADALTVWRRSSADEIERDLAVLWRETAREGPLSRALMANLVVIEEREGPTEETGAAAREAVVFEVAQRHPVRAILLDYVPGVEAPGAPKTARVGLRTFGSSAARYGIELIAVQTACAEASIPSVVRRLTRGGVPTAVWWLGDLSRNPPSELMTTLGRQFLYDSALWSDPREGFLVVAGLLARAHAPDIADLNWGRLAPMRHALEHAVRSDPAALELRATGIEIRHGARRSASAWLLAGWVCGSLGWSSEEVSWIEEGGDSPDALNAVLSGSNWTVILSMDDHRVRVTGTNQTPFEVLVPRATDADRVADELRSLATDTALHTAVRTAAVLAQ